MARNPARRPFIRKVSALLAVLGVLAAVTTIWFAAEGVEDVSAAGSCGTAHDGMTAEESQLLGMVSDWRIQNGIANAVPLQPSGPLNRAAAWYAEDLATGGSPGGHRDSEGRWFNDRARDCGYDNFWSDGTGEGVYSIGGSGQLSVGPNEALTGLTYPGSGVYMATPSGYQHVNCAGVGVFRTANSVAWVVVLAQYDDDVPCPEPASIVQGPPTATASASASASASPTPTTTPTATPTATPTSTPQARFNATLDLVPGQWNLVTLPAGEISSVLARAAGCYVAVYRVQPDGSWLRYAPGVPGYARSLQTSDGGAYWVMASAQDCGEVDL